MRRRKRIHRWKIWRKHKKCLCIFGKCVLGLRGKSLKRAVEKEFSRQLEEYYTGIEKKLGIWESIPFYHFVRDFTETKWKFVWEKEWRDIPRLDLITALGASTWRINL